MPAGSCSSVRTRPRDATPGTAVLWVTAAADRAGKALASQAEGWSAIYCRPGCEVGAPLRCRGETTEPGPIASNRALAARELPCRASSMRRDSELESAGFGSPGSFNDVGVGSDTGGSCTNPLAASKPAARHIGCGSVRFWFHERQISAKGSIPEVATHLTRRHHGRGARASTPHGSRLHPSLPQRGLGNTPSLGASASACSGERGRNDETHPARGGADRGGRARRPPRPSSGPARSTSRNGSPTTGASSTATGAGYSETCRAFGSQFEFDGRTYTVDLFYITNTPRSCSPAPSGGVHRGILPDRPRSGVGWSMGSGSSSPTTTGAPRSGRCGVDNSGLDWQDGQVVSVQLVQAATPVPALPGAGAVLLVLYDRTADTVTVDGESAS